jgi:hypothetical protein
MELVAITLEDRSLRLVPLPGGGVDLRATEGLPGPDSVFERLDLSHGRIALRVPDGRYLARHVEHLGMPTDEGATLHLVDELIQCAAFEELPLPGGYLSLRACDLRFLGVHTSGRVVADRVSNGSWERFRYLEIPAPVIRSVPLRDDPVTPGSVQHAPVPPSGVPSTGMQSTAIPSTGGPLPSYLPPSSFGASTTFGSYGHLASVASL